MSKTDEHEGGFSADMLKFVELRYDAMELVLGLKQEVVDCFELRLTVRNVSRKEMCTFMEKEVHWQKDKIIDPTVELQATWTHLNGLKKEFCESWALLLYGRGYFG